jgi:hypothetical protein
LIDLQLMTPVRWRNVTGFEPYNPVFEDKAGFDNTAGFDNNPGFDNTPGPEDCPGLEKAPVDITGFT